MSSPIRNSILFGIIVSLTPSLSYGQLNWLNDAFPADKRTHDFGTVARAAKTEYRFQVKNTSGQTIELGGIRTSCGCTTPTIETKVIPPGETGTILAKFNTGSFTGQKQATVTVTVIKPVYTEIQLIVRGYIRSDVVVFPGEAAFGQVDEGAGKTLKLDVDYAGRSNWSVNEVTSDSEFVKASVTETSRGSGRVKYKLQVELADNAPSGFLQSQLVLHTNDNRLTTVPVALTADVQPSIQMSPSSLALGSVSEGQPISKRLVVKGKKPFRILEITSSDLNVDFDPTEKAKNVHMIHVDLLPAGEKLGARAGKVLVKTDLREEPLALDLTFDLKQREITTSKKD